MRLIDADYLKRVLDSGGSETTEINISKSMPIGKIVDTVIHAYRKCLFAELEKVPTAYDLDKVMEQLDVYAHSSICRSHMGRCPYRAEDDIFCENCGAMGALEIVKSGGIE